MDYILFVCNNVAKRADEATEYFIKKGYTVLRAPNGEEALKVIQEQGAFPIVIFAELILPVMDGLELTQLFKREHPESATQILLAGPLMSQNHFFDWDFSVSNFLHDSYSAVQLILAIEQLLYRRITKPEDRVRLAS